MRRNAKEIEKVKEEKNAAATLNKLTYFMKLLNIIQYYIIYLKNITCICHNKIGIFIAKWSFNHGNYVALKVLKITFISWGNKFLGFSSCTILLCKMFGIANNSNKLSTFSLILLTFCCLWMFACSSSYTVHLHYILQLLSLINVLVLKSQNKFLLWNNRDDIPVVVTTGTNIHWFEKVVSQTISFDFNIKQLHWAQYFCSLLFTISAIFRFSAF